MSSIKHYHNPKYYARRPFAAEGASAAVVDQHRPEDVLFTHCDRLAQDDMSIRPFAGGCDYPLINSYGVINVLGPGSLQSRTTRLLGRMPIQELYAMAQRALPSFGGLQVEPFRPMHTDTSIFWEVANQICLCPHRGCIEIIAVSRPKMEVNKAHERITLDDKKNTSREAS